MSQLNIHMTPVFERDLRQFMKVRHLKSKAEALRVAVREGLEHSLSHVTPADFNKWLGLGIQVPVNKNTRFHSDGDLWK